MAIKGAQSGPFSIPLDTAGQSLPDPAAVGWKFRRLAELHRHGFLVPPAAVLTTALEKEVESKGRSALLRELEKALDGLDLSRGLAARSSSAAEDLSGASFAGQYETTLSIRTMEDLAGAVETCWASGRSEAARDYANRVSAGTGPRPVAVIVQQMLDPQWAGVAFTADPVTGSNERLIVELCPGLADPLVSGNITPARVELDRSLALMASVLPDEFEERKGEIHEVARRVAREALKVEEAFGSPQDIEWGFSERSVHFLQTRPITALPLPIQPFPPGRYTRKICDDLWADRLTPFEESLLSRFRRRFDLSRFADALGLHELLRFDPLHFIRGYLYIDLQVLEAALAFVPPFLRLRSIQKLFPPGMETETISPVGRRRMAGILLRSGGLALAEPALIPPLTLRISRGKMNQLSRRLEKTQGGASTRIESIAWIIGDLLEANQAGYIYATVFTWALHHVVTDVAGKPHADFLKVLGGAGKYGNATERANKALGALSMEVVSHEGLAKALEGAEGKEALSGVLALLENSGAARHWNDFVTRYGARTGNRSLLCPRWEESPEEVLLLLKSFFAGGAGRRSTASERRRAAENVAKVLPWRWRWIWPVLSGMTRDFLDLREDLRWLLDRALWALRKAMLERAADLGWPDNLVFFLRIEDLCELDKGTAGVIGEKRRLAEERAAGWKSPGRPPVFLVDGVPVEEFPVEGTTLKGTGASAGRVRGRARHVFSPVEGMRFGRGDIIIAHNTDPGWTPLFGRVGGIVAEEGGLLNHASIVARELGLPAVVGVRGALRRIPDGSSILLDGGNGEIVLEA